MTVLPAQQPDRVSRGVFDNAHMASLQIASALVDDVSLSVDMSVLRVFDAGVHDRRGG